MRMFTLFREELHNTAFTIVLFVSRQTNQQLWTRLQLPIFDKLPYPPDTEVQMYCPEERTTLTAVKFHTLPGALCLKQKGLDKGVCYPRQYQKECKGLIKTPFPKKCSLTLPKRSSYRPLFTDNLSKPVCNKR